MTQNRSERPYSKPYRDHRGYNLHFEHNPRGNDVRLFAYRAGKINFTVHGANEEACIGLLNAHILPKHKKHKFHKYGQTVDNE